MKVLLPSGTKLMKTTKLKIGHKEQEFTVVESHGKELLLDISNGQLEVWADKFKIIEPDLLQFLSKLTEDDILYDVGASIGHFSVFAAMFAGKTYAFEPEAQNYSTASLNKFANSDRLKGELSIFNLALSDRMQIGNITIGSYGAGEHTKSIDRYSRYDHLTQSSIQTAGKSQENIVEDDVIAVEPSNSGFRRGDAVSAISEDPKVVEAIFPNNSSNSFWVSMFDDGSRRDGYAQYVCQILRDHGMPSNKLIVIRIWDATEMARENFKELGKHECLFR